MTDVALDGPELSFSGALDVERTANGVIPRRLPAWTRPQVSDPFMQMVVAMPSGVRLRFDTTSDTLELGAQLTTFRIAPNAMRTMVFDVVADGAVAASVGTQSANCLVIEIPRSPTPVFEPGGVATVRVEGLGTHRKTVEVHLPQSAIVELQTLRLADGAQVWAAPPVSGTRWFHYGSSISHCMEAGTPTGVWPVVAAGLAGVNLTNLGFAGQCHLDQFVARTVRDTAMDLFTMKVGINVVNADSLRERTFTPAVEGFLDTIREGQPDLPIVVVSPIFCPPAEAQPGPTIPGPDGKFFCAPRQDADSFGSLTLQRIRVILEKVVARRVAAGDTNLSYVDGLSLFGPADAGDLPDDLHPNTEGYLRMGQRFHAQVLAPLLSHLEG